MLLVVIRRLDLPERGTQRVSAPQVRRVARLWAKQQQQRCRAKQQKWSETLLVQTATAWLQFLGRLQEPPVRSAAYAGWLGRFVTHLTETGKASATIGNYQWQAHHFLRWWYRAGRQLRHLRAQDLDRYFQHLSLRRVGTSLARLGSQGPAAVDWVCGPAGMGFVELGSQD